MKIEENVDFLSEFLINLSVCDTCNEENLLN